MGRFEIKDKITSLIENNCSTRKLQIWCLLEWLEKNGFYTAPASSMYHNNFEGGLVLHSYNVANTLLQVNAALSNRISAESCIITGLFHDVHKVCDGFGNTTYVPNILKNGKVSDSKPYEKNKDILAFSDGYKSVMLVNRFVDLYAHEMQAIAGHDGQYVPDNRGMQLKEHPLTIMLHFVDMWNSQFIETEDSLFNKSFNTKFMGGIDKSI